MAIFLGNIFIYFFNVSAQRKLIYDFKLLLGYEKINKNENVKVITMVGRARAVTYGYAFFFRGLKKI